MDSVFWTSKTSKNYFPQVFLEEYKSVVKVKKMHKYITDDIEFSSGGTDEELLISKIRYRMYLVFDVSNNSSLYITKKKLLSSK